LEWFAVQGFLPMAEKNKQITDNQGGARKGRSTINLVARKWQATTLSDYTKL